MAEGNKKNVEKPKTSMFALVQAGKEEAEKVQNIKSVSAQTTEEIAPEVEEPVPVITARTDNEASIESEQEEAIETKKEAVATGLSMIFSKREVKDTETVKIPREFHQELKILSTMSKTPMMQMLGNLIESFLNENKKEIASYKKKYLTGSLGKK